MVSDWPPLVVPSTLPRAIEPPPKVRSSNWRRASFVPVTMRLPEEGDDAGGWVEVDERDDAARPRDAGRRRRQRDEPVVEGRRAGRALVDEGVAERDLTGELDAWLPSPDRVSVPAAGPPGSVATMAVAGG